MRKFFKIFPSFMVLALLAACSAFNGTRLEPYLGTNLDLVHLGNEIADTLIATASPPLVPRPLGQSVLIVSLVSNDDLKKSSSFGRVLQEHIRSEFVRQGYSVKEIKLTSALLVRSGQGEFMLSRRLSEISLTQRAQAVVVGTYTLADQVMYLSVKMVDPQDQTVVAAWDKKLFLDENSLHLLGLQFEESDGFDPPRESFLNKLFY